MDNTEMSVRVIGGPTAVLEIGGLRLVTDYDPPSSTARQVRGERFTCAKSANG